MPNRLTGLKVDLVSFVDRAAVRDPQNKSEPRRFVLWKREDGAPTDTTDSSEGGNMPNGTTDASAVEKAEQELLDAIEKAEAAGVDIEKLSAKGNGPAPGDDPSDDPDHEGDAMHDKKPAAKGANTPGGAESAGSDVTKSEGLSPEVRALIEKAENERVQLAKRVEAAEAVAKQERDLRVEREFVAKAEGLAEFLPTSAGELGPVLKRASENLEKADYEYLESLIRGANNAVEKGDLFSQVGRSGQPPATAEGDIISKVQKAAEEIRKSDNSISEARALEMAMKADPELQRQYMAENGVGAR